MPVLCRTLASVQRRAPLRAMSQRTTPQCSSPPARTLVLHTYTLQSAMPNDVRRDPDERRDTWMLVICLSRSMHHASYAMQDERMCYIFRADACNLGSGGPETNKLPSE